MEEAGVNPDPCRSFLGMRMQRQRGLWVERARLADGDDDNQRAGEEGRGRDSEANWWQQTPVWVLPVVGRTSSGCCGEGGGEAEETGHCRRATDMSILGVACTSLFFARPFRPGADGGSVSEPAGVCLFASLPGLFSLGLG